VARDGQDVRVTWGSTYDNRKNFAPTFFSQNRAAIRRERLGRQELAELLEDVPGALWTEISSCETDASESAFRRCAGSSLPLIWWWTCARTAMKLGFLYASSASTIVVASWRMRAGNH
jgi:hypothetical protein